MKESLSSKHSRKLFRNTLKNLLNGSCVSNECGGHLEAPWWDVTDSSLDIVGDPLDEVAAVLVLDVQHLLVHLHTEGDGEDEKEEKMRRKSKSFFSHLLH